MKSGAEATADKSDRLEPERSQPWRSQPQMSSFLSGKFHHVDVDRIERELLELWQQASKVGDDGLPSVTRACSMNFILLSTDPDCEIGADMLEDITFKHPCRAILAHATPSEVEHLEAFVTARCRLVAGKKSQICCEQINVRWEGQGTRPLASVVLPLRIADLPTWLWWHKTRPTKEMIGPFLPFIDHLVVDTKDMSGQLNHLFDLKDVLFRLDDETALYDLNWGRLLSWRQSLARAFQPARGLMTTEDLDLIDNIEIVVADGARMSEQAEHSLSGHTGTESGAEQSGVGQSGAGKAGAETSGTRHSGAGQPGTEHSPFSTQALLMVAWLATRLSWRFVEASRKQSGEVSIVFALGRRRIDISIKTIASDAGAGNILRLALDFIGNNEETLLVSQISGTPGLAERIVKCKGGSNGKPLLAQAKDNEPLTLVEKTSADLVIETLDNSLTAQVYQELLELVCEMAASVK